MRASPCWTLVILSFNLFTACGQRTTDTPTLGSSGLGLPAQQVAGDNDRTAELEKLIRDQSDALTKLSTDKATLQERSATLDEQVKVLNEQLATNKTLTEQQKADLQKQITDMQTQKAELDKQIVALNTKNTDLQKQLDDAKTENVRLQKELAAAKAGQPTTTTTTAAAKYYGFRYADPTKVKNDCLDVPGGSTADGVQIISYPCAVNSLNQQFAVDNPNNQFFAIKPRLSNKCLTANGTGEGAAVIQKTCTGTADQSWEFFVRGQADFRLRNQSSGKCMKIQTDGKIVQGDCNTNSTYFNWFVAG